VFSATQLYSAGQIFITHVTEGLAYRSFILSHYRYHKSPAVMKVIISFMIIQPGKYLPHLSM